MKAGLEKKVFLALWLLALGGCLRGGDGPLPDGGWPMASGPQVIIGLADDALTFSPLEQGGDIPLQSFGQGGTHAALAVRCIGLGDQAFVEVTLENLATGQTVSTPRASRPVLLACSAQGCDLAPLFVMTGGLADPEDKDGLRIRVTAEVENTEGQSATASVEAVLRR